MGACRSFEICILKHPNVVHTTDGKAKPYIHGKDRTIGTTANIYTHTDENSKIASAEAIMPILNF